MAYFEDFINAISSTFSAMISQNDCCEKSLLAQHQHNTPAGEITRQITDCLSVHITETDPDVCSTWAWQTHTRQSLNGHLSAVRYDIGFSSGDKCIFILSFKTIPYGNVKDYNKSDSPP